MAEELVKDSGTMTKAATSMAGELQFFKLGGRHRAMIAPIQHRTGRCHHHRTMRAPYKLTAQRMGTRQRDKEKGHPNGQPFCNLEKR